MKRGLTMFSKVESAIIKVLKDNLKTVPNENIIIGEIKTNSLPVISINNVDFEVKEVGFGRSVGSVELKDVFSGDSKTKKFTLKVKPLKPIIDVEYPPGNKLKENAYTVDYESAVITFISAPKKAKDNILIKYLKPTETKGMTYNLRYHLNIWGKDETQRDAITVDVMKTLLKEEDSLNREDMILKPTRGFNIPQNGEPQKGAHGKTLEYIIETGLEVEIPLTRIEKIEIKRT